MYHHVGAQSELICIVKQGEWQGWAIIWGGPLKLTRFSAHGQHMG
jgi:hypothetical protein